MKYKFILFSPWLLKSPVNIVKFTIIIILINMMNIINIINVYIYIIY